MSAYATTRQVQAWASRCDDATHGIIQPRTRRVSTLLTRGGGVVGTAAEPMKFLGIALRCAWGLNPHGEHTNAGAAVPAESGGAGRQAVTLVGFFVWFCRRFAKVEAAREAKNQIEVRFG